MSSPQFARAKQEAQTIKAYAGQEIAQGAKDGIWERQNRQSGALPANLPVSPDNGSSTGNSGDLANVSYSQVRPSGNFVQTQNSVFTMAHPDNWQVFQSQNGGGLTIAPLAGVGQGAVAYGMMINAGKDPNAATLDEATQNLVGSLQQSNPGLRAGGSAQKIQVDGRDARSVELQGKSPVQQNGQPLSERDWLIVLPNGSGGQLLYFVFIAPRKHLRAAAFDLSTNARQRAVPVIVSSKLSAAPRRSVRQHGTPYIVCKFRLSYPHLEAHGGN